MFMNAAQKINESAKTADHTACRQKALPGRVAPSVLLSLTNQATREHHVGIRVTAHADRSLRGWTANDVFRMKDLLDYAESIGDPSPLVLVTKNLAPGTPAVVLGAHLAHIEAVRQIDAELADRAEEAATQHRWWQEEHADILSA